MRVTVKCDNCGHEEVLGVLPDRHVCPTCGAVTSFVPPKVKKIPPPKKRPFSHGWKFMAEVVSHPERGLLLACDRPPSFKPFILEGRSKWTSAELAGLRVSLEVVRVRADGMLIVKLVAPPPIVKKRLLVVRIPAERLSRKEDVELAFPPPGKSELEEMVIAGDPGVIGRIDHLEGRKDDPVAWWILALGHRSSTIRLPVQEALIAVGIEKIDRMVRQSYYFDWDVDLMDFIGEEMAKPKPRGGLGTTLPGDRQGWDKPWWADD